MKQLALEVAAAAPKIDAMIDDLSMRVLTGLAVDLPAVMSPNYVAAKESADRVVGATLPERQQCGICLDWVSQVCRDRTCRACHKTESFEACLANKQVNEIRKNASLPPMEDR